MNKFEKRYLKEFGDSFTMVCANCYEETPIENKLRLRYEDEESGMIKVGYLLAYQCQSYGKFELFGGTVGPSYEGLIEEKCECGGEFRRDKHIFCNKCFYNKFED